MNQDKRRTPRFVFIAIAELTHRDSGVQIVSRVSQLSLYGCYVDLLNTLPVGTAVAMKIFAESQYFEANAMVIYAHPNLGMGLTFQEVSLKSGALLRQWLVEASALQEKSNS